MVSICEGNLARASAFLACVLLSLCSTVSHALDYRYENRNPSNGAPYRNPTHQTLFISGEIRKGDAKRFVDFIAADPDRYLRTGNVLISSPGGDVTEAIAIADILKNTYRSVTVSEWFGPCISACFYIVAASALREITDGQIGLHRPYLPPKTVENASLADLEAVQRRAYDTVRVELQSLGVPAHLVEAMISRASNEVYWLTAFDKRALGRRAPWFEQVIVSRCNLNKSLEDRYFSQITPGLDDALESYVNGIIDCQWRVIGDAPRDFLVRLLSAHTPVRH